MRVYFVGNRVMFSVDSFFTICGSTSFVANTPIKAEQTMMAANSKLIIDFLMFFPPFYFELSTLREKHILSIKLSSSCLYSSFLLPI